MKAIIKNVLLAFILSTFAFFGLLGSSDAHRKLDAKLTGEQKEIRQAQVDKQTFTLFAVIGVTWVICFWRCKVINKRLNTERMYQQRFNEYMRTSAFRRQHY